jgi:hypothetical protein
MYKTTNTIVRQCVRSQLSPNKLHSKHLLSLDPSSLSHLQAATFQKVSNPKCYRHLLFILAAYPPHCNLLHLTAKVKCGEVHIIKQA